LWLHGLPALGLPGSNAASCLDASHLEGIETLYFVREPDRGGDALAAQLPERLARLEFSGRVFEARMPSGVKDPSDLHSLDPKKFLNEWGTITTTARRIDRGDAWDGGLGTRSGGSCVRPQGWEEPLPLSALPEATAFPLSVLPEDLKAFVEEAAWALNCPVDFVAVPLLALAGGAIGNARRLAITDSHDQGAAIFAVVVGQPGSGKSPALELASAPLEEAERRLMTEWKRQVAEWEEVDPKARGKRPVPRRLLVDNATTEALAPVLATNPRGVVMLRDELAALVTGLGQYKSGRGDDRQFYLKLWSQGTIRVDRKSRGDEGPIQVCCPFVAVVGGIQPGVLATLRGDERGRRHADDGFLDRFLFSLPDDLPAAGEQWREVSSDASRAWANAVECLLALSAADPQEPGGEGRPVLLRLDSEGRRAWERFTARHAAELNDPEFPDHLRGPWSKLRGYCGRLALVLHELHRACYGDGVGRDVCGEIVDRAASLTDYFKAHRRRVALEIDSDPRLAEAHQVLACLARHEGMREGFTRRDLYQKLRRRFDEPEALDRPLKVLEEHGYIRQIPAEKDAKGRSVVRNPAFEVNPLWDLQERTQRTQRTQDP
jgi:hypothetical protein